MCYKLKKKLVLIFIGWFSQFSVAYSQKYPAFLLNEKDGLDDNVVQSIAVDHKGFLWIGTKRGLSRYDGNGFKNYHKSDGLAGENIKAIAVDDNNRIFVGCCSEGITILKDGKVQRTIKISNPHENSIRNFLWDSKGQCLVFGTEWGLYLLRDSAFTKVKVSCEHEQDDKGWKTSIVTLKRYKGRIFFTVYGKHSPGLYELILDPDSLENSKSVPFYCRKDFWALTFYKDKILATSDTFLYCFSLSGEKAGNEILYADKNLKKWRNLFLLPDNGIMVSRFFPPHDRSVIFNVAEKKIEEFPWIMPDEHIYTVFVDSTQKIVWVGTSNGILALEKSPFSYYETVGLGDVVDKGFWKGNLYILQKDGIYVLKDGGVEKIISREQIRRVLREKVRRYFRNNKGRMDSILARPLSLRNFVTDENILYLNTSIGSIEIPDMMTYQPFCCGRFITTDEGVYHFRDYKNIYFYQNGDLSKKRKFFPKDKVMLNVSLLRGRDGMVYMPTYFHGIFAARGDRLYHLDKNIGEVDATLKDADVDSKGDLWVISGEGNLFHLTFHDSLILLNMFNRFNSPLVGEDLKWLKFRNGLLYLATNKGLNVFSEEDLHSEKLQKYWFYNKNNGYLDYSTYNPVPGEGEYIFVNTKKQLLRIGPPDFEEKDEKIVIREVSVDGEKMNNELFLEGKTNNYSHKTRNIHLVFFLMKYPSDRNVKYKYRINNGPWIDNNHVTISYPKPGEYRISLAAKDLETNKLYHKELSVGISSPLWHRWWFDVFSLIVAFGGVAFFFKKRYEHVRKEEEEKNRMRRESAGLRIQALQMQMNPHFIFNALNTIQSAVLQKEKEDVLNFIGDLSIVIRENLENVSKDYIPLSEEIAFLQKYVSIERFILGKKLDVDFYISVPDPDNLLIPPMLIEPLVENSIKHGIQPKKEGGEIDIWIEERVGFLLVTIKDNGIGRKKAMEFSQQTHRGKGILLLKTRLRYLNQKNNTSTYRIEYEDLYEKGKPAGTEVRLYLQIIQREGRPKE